tara:strand:+ start:594 stop:1022 length:429 start_codon:yes stop_codon:yes gene_type:complete
MSTYFIEKQIIHSKVYVFAKSLPEHNKQCMESYISECKKAVTDNPERPEYPDSPWFVTEQEAKSYRNGIIFRILPEKQIPGLEWVLVTEHDVSIRIPELDIRNGLVNNAKEHKERIAAQSDREIQELDERIQSLLALPYVPS